MEKLVHYKQNGRCCSVEPVEVFALTKWEYYATADNLCKKPLWFFLKMTMEVPTRDPPCAALGSLDVLLTVCRLDRASTTPTLRTRTTSSGLAFLGQRQLLWPLTFDLMGIWVVGTGLSAQHQTCTWACCSGLVMLNCTGLRLKRAWSQAPSTWSELQK